MSRHPSILIASIVLSAACSQERAPGEGGSAVDPAPAAAAPTAASPGGDQRVSAEDNRAFCEALLGEAARQAMGVEEPWRFSVRAESLGYDKYQCDYQWPAEENKAPKGLLMAVFDCGKLQVDRAGMERTWRDKAVAVDVDGPALRIDLVIPQHWFFSDAPRCAVMATAAFGAKELAEPWARHVRAQIGRIDSARR